MLITIQSLDGVHVASCQFGASSHGSPSESLDVFLKQLRTGKWETEPEKVSKSGSFSPQALPPWHPMDCGELGVGYLGDDFRPFVGKRLKRVERNAWAARYVTES